jgi:hypothetical protein
MKRTKVITEPILRTIEYVSRLMILMSVKWGKMMSVRAKPGTKNSMRNPKITLRPSKITATVSIAQISLHYENASSRLSFRYI